MSRRVLQKFARSQRNGIDIKRSSDPALLMRGADDSDASLVTELKRRDEAAFTEMVKRHQRLLLSVAFRITGNPEDAEEVVQDAFLKVFQNIEGFRGESRFRTWLTRIAINEALMKMRRNTGIWLSLDDERESGIQAAIMQLRSSASTPEETCSLHEIQALARSLISQIKIPYQSMMRLCLHLDLSQNELAKHLGLTPGKVKSRLFRARRQLRDVLERRCGRNRGSMFHGRKKSMDGQPHVGGLFRDVVPRVFLR